MIGARSGGKRNEKNLFDDVLLTSFLDNGGFSDSGAGTCTAEAGGIKVSRRWIRVVLTFAVMQLAGRCLYAPLKIDRTLKIAGRVVKRRGTIAALPVWKTAQLLPPEPVSSNLRAIFFH